MERESQSGHADDGDGRFCGSYRLHRRRGGTPDETIRIRTGELTWKKAQFENGIIDFDRAAGAIINHSLAGYAVCYVKERRGLRLKIGTSDQARVYLNGKALYEYPFGGYLTGE